MTGAAVVIECIDQRHAVTVPSNAASRLLRQECQWIDPDLLSESFDRLEAEVPFPAFDGAEVGAVEAELVGEVLLADALILAVGAQVATKSLLQVTFHLPMASGRYLLVYRLISSGASGE